MEKFRETEIKTKFIERNMEGEQRNKKTKNTVFYEKELEFDHRQLKKYGLIYKTLEKHFYQKYIGYIIFN